MTPQQPILAVLRVFCTPGQVVELRALGVQNRRAVCEVHGDLSALAHRAAELDAAGAVGVYFTPNPIRPDLVGSRASCKAADVLERHWLLIDVDPCRPAGLSSTEDELQTAWTVLDRCQAVLNAAGLVNHVIGCSGNGWHLAYPVLLPNDQAAHDLLKAVLKGLQERCGDQLTAEEMAVIKTGQVLSAPKARLDTSCHDALRIWKLYGTSARKGRPTAERPHRQAFLVEGQPWAQATGGANVQALTRLLEGWRYAENIRRGRPQTSVQTYLQKALQQEQEAIRAHPVGNGLNDQLSRSAFNIGTLVQQPDGLSYGDAFDALYQAALQAGANDPTKDRGTIDRQLREGMKRPRDLQQLESNRPRPLQADMETGPAEAGPVKIEFPAPIPASQLQEGDQTTPIWKGLINRGAITLMCALWKAGKTTLLVHLIRAMEEGGSFCGLGLTPGKVLYVTEESESRWAKRRDRHVLHDNIDFLIRPFTAKPGWPQWLAFLAYLSSLEQEKSHDLLIFDTLTNLWPVRDENDAGQVQGALMPLHNLGPAGLMLVHHTRKGDGQEATASRGSGALTAFVDTIVEFRRYSQDDREDRRRVLTAYGRDEDTPDELVIELTDLDGYVPQGKRSEVKSVDLAQQILPLLPTEPPGITFDELMARWAEQAKPHRRTAFQALSKGVDNALWRKEGRGVRGDPHRYWVPPVPAIFREPVNGTPEQHP